MIDATFKSLLVRVKSIASPSWRKTFVKNGIRRCLSTPASSSKSGPPPKSTSWGRNAAAAKNTDLEGKYLDHIRDMHDPSQHIKTLEEEMMGTMGQALGKQDEKVAMAIRAMEKEMEHYSSLLSSNAANERPGGCGDGSLSSSSENNKKLQESARRYNELREKAKVARWELIVHRQAVGFTRQNHKLIHEMYPIGDALPVTQPEEPVSGGKTLSTDGDDKQKFGTQTDWWDRIGRWR